MTAQGGLAHHLTAFGTDSVLCVGDAMLDRFVYGTVDRISPEAPIPVLQIVREREMLGGAGNVARNIAALGAPCVFISVIGEDSAGRRILRLLAETPGIEAYVASDPARRSTVKVRYIANGQQLLRADQEVSAALSAAEEKRAISNACDAVGTSSAVVLSDYGKGAVSDLLAGSLIDEARRRGRPVIVDPKATHFARYRRATVVTPNTAELAQAVGRPLSTVEEIIAAAEGLIEQLDLGALLVTRGREGMSLIEPGRVTHFPTRARDVFDVSGAGDTVVAVLATAMGAGVPLVEAVQIANVAAGMVVGKVGTATITQGDLAAALRGSDRHSHDNQVVAPETALDQVAQWRAGNARIGFTNGCFDLLHPGHVSLLRQARARCDRLVVGLNTDASVARLKGTDRPVQDQDARALVLASLEMVDLVVLFDDDTPVELIRTLRPDLLVKGADYTLDQVVGGDLVRSYGGEIFLASLEDGHSTTDVIARMVR